MKLQIFLSTNDGTIFIFVPEKSNDIKSQAEESVMLGFNPGIYFLDIRVKPEYDNYLFVVPVFFSFPLFCHVRAYFLFVIVGLDPTIQRSPERAALVRE